MEPNWSSAEFEQGYGRSIVHLTRAWIQYGVCGFAVFCILVGAVEALFGR